jgi:hypothetical protein
MSIKFRHIIFPFLMTLFFLSSSFMTKKKLSIEAYLNWYNSNNSFFKKTIQDGEFNYTLYLIPNQMELIRQYKSKQITIEEFNTQINKSSNLTFRLEISSPNLGNKDFIKEIPAQKFSYDDRVKYFSFDFGKDIKVVNGKSDTLYSTGYLFERGNGLKPYSLCNLEYDTKIIKDTLRVFINNKVYNQKLDFAFVFDKKTELPELKKIKK